MGEKAQEGSHSRRQLPAAGAVALGAVVGLAVAAPFALVMTGGGDDDDVAVVAPATTTTLAPTESGGSAGDSLPEGPFAVIVAVDQVDLPVEADLFPSGQVFPGTTLTCDATSCRLDLVFSTIVATIELVREGDTLTGAFDFDAEEPRCAGTGTGTGSGTVVLTIDGDGFRGDIDFAADNPTEVERDGGRCIGGTFRLDLVATPAGDPPPDGTYDVTATLTSYELANGADAFSEGSTFDGTTLTCAGATCQLSVAFPTVAQTIELTRDGNVASGQFTYETVQDNGGCDDTGVLTGAGAVTLIYDGSAYRGTVNVRSDTFEVVDGEFGPCVGGRFQFEIVATPR